MVIGLIADDSKKELLIQLCIAYCGILSKHSIFATNTIGKYISETTGLSINPLMTTDYKGEEQFCSKVSYDEIDVLIYFRSSSPTENGSAASRDLLRLCDIHNVPVATNMASAEIILRSVDRGDLDWREIVNPNSEYNRRKRRRYVSPVK